MSEETELLQRVPARLRAVRLKENLSQAVMGHRMGKDQQFIQRLESGKNLPTLVTLYQISKAINKPLSYVVDID